VYDSKTPCVAHLKVLADQTRLSVISILMGGPRFVRELVAALDIEQTLLSHHLRVLREAGFVQTQRMGKSIQYSVTDVVQVTRRERVIDLGCCRLVFDDSHFRS
jgi:DNA-binding transcriptional ArsR family regulator